MGRIRLNFTIGSQTFSHDAWIADIVDECLLGLDFLGSQHRLMQNDTSSIGLLNYIFPHHSCFFHGITSEDKR